MPWTTLIRSYTTRRSAPITKSRLRRPTSKSITTTFCPKVANAAPRAAVDVVLPTPPLPDVTTTTLPICHPPAPFQSKAAIISASPSSHACTGRLRSLEQWRQARAEARRIRAFNADDADFAPLQVRNEIRKFGLGQVEACEIEDDRFPNKKALGAPHLTVELGHPVAKRQLWRK